MTSRQQAESQKASREDNRGTAPRYDQLPSVHLLAEADELADAIAGSSRSVVVSVIRAVLAEWRGRICAGDGIEVSHEQIVRDVLTRLGKQQRWPLPEAINGTGILLHTGLGRAPLSDAALAAVERACRGYTPLEVERTSGKRGERSDLVRERLCMLTGAESALVVNNNAAALLLALNTLARGRQVVVSRGELIEIGGSFRLPDIMSASGAQLCEVGTTNRTRSADYAAAIGDATAALLKVHPSNYAVTGFAQSVSLAELVVLGRRHALPVLHDIGSGAVFDPGIIGLNGEPVARVSIQQGADLVLFSGDKLLAGPQAGILVGRREWIERLTRNPLARALRVDKMTLAALSATLAAFDSPERAARELPVWRMATTSVSELSQRAQRIAAALKDRHAGLDVEVISTTAYLGGGSLPNQGLESLAIAVQHDRVSEEEVARRLRIGSPAVFGRLQNARLMIDLRTVLPQQDGELIAAIAAALSP